MGMGNEHSDLQCLIFKIDIYSKHTFVNIHVLCPAYCATVLGNVTAW